jgi:ferredoxin-NADP reductase
MASSPTIRITTPRKSSKLNRMNLTFVSREELAPAIWQYHFKPERPFDFVPGQYADFVLPGVHDDPRGASRVYTMTSQPRDDVVSFVMKVPEPHSPHKQALIELRPGDPLQVRESMGDLILPKDPAQPLVFIAGGIGIASFISMLQYLTDKREERPIFLFYSLRVRQEAIFKELLAKYPLTLNVLTIAPNRLTGQQIIDSTPPNALIYLSGSQRFVEQLRVNLEHLGKPRSDIVFDFFDGYAEL